MKTYGIGDRLYEEKGKPIQRICRVLTVIHGHILFIDRQPAVLEVKGQTLRKGFTGDPEVLIGIGKQCIDDEGRRLF